MRFPSPLRYPGGKNKIVDFVKNVFEENDLLGGYFVEPYAGGASVALSLLYDQYASNIIINDFDKSIYAFWFSILNHTEDFCRLINDTPITLDSWLEQKQIQKHKEETDLIELGFSTFFLNRTNRSGIIKAGVIGGYSQSGNYKIGARYNKSKLIERIEKIAVHKNSIVLYNLDAIELIKKINKKLKEKALIYFDPPYYVKGKDLYVNHYNHKDHVEVSKMIKGIKRHKWIVSYDNVKEIKELYNESYKIEYELRYSAANTTKGSEVMFYHKNLQMPLTLSPIQVVS